MDISKKNLRLMLGGHETYSILQKDVRKREGKRLVLNLDSLVERSLHQVLVLLIYVVGSVAQRPQETPETIRVSLFDQREDALIRRNAQSRVARFRRVSALRDHLLVE